MSWAFDSERPIYAQLVERIRSDIIIGKYMPGERLPSVRDLSAEASVNPNTMQKALAELEQTGLVNTQRTSGRFITEDRAMIMEVRENQATEHVKSFLLSMNTLGYSTREIIQLLSKIQAQGEAEANEQHS